MIMKALGLTFSMTRQMQNRPCAGSAKSEMVFEALTSEAAWKAMLPIDGAEWHGPLGKDTDRTIAAKDAEMLEQFFEWEDGRKFGFRLARGLIGILQAMAERYEVIPTSETRCEVVITFRIRTKASPNRWRLFCISSSNRPASENP